MPRPASQTFEHALWCERSVGHADADGVEDRVADRGGGRDSRRLADADDAALRHVVQMNDDLRHVFDAAELVELHVGIALPAGIAVHDAFFKQGVVNAHDDAPGHLGLAGQLVNDEAAVLHRDKLGAADHAGLSVD